MPPSCCTAAVREFQSPMFDLVEPSVPSNANEDEGSSNVLLDSNSARRLDIEKTLSPRHRLLYIGAKLFILAWIASILCLSITSSTHPSFWLAYLTHWGFLCTTAYSMMSFFSAVCLAVCPPANPGVLEGWVGLLVKTTWALMAIAVPAEVMITILFWVLEFDYAEDTVQYVSVMVHGGGMVLIIIDGFILSRLPLRIKQFILFEFFSFLYLIWTVVHALSGVGNPYADDGTQSDDAVYATLAWKNATVPSLVLSVGVLLVGNPIIFLFLRAVSRLPPRRLCGGEEGERHFSAYRATEV